MPTDPEIYKQIYGVYPSDYVQNYGLDPAKLRYGDSGLPGIQQITPINAPQPDLPTEEEMQKNIESAMKRGQFITPTLNPTYSGSYNLNKYNVRYDPITSQYTYGSRITPGNEVVVQGIKPEEIEKMYDEYKAKSNAPVSFDEFNKVLDEQFKKMNLSKPVSEGARQGLYQLYLKEGKIDFSSSKPESEYIETTTLTFEREKPMTFNKFAETLHADELKRIKSPTFISSSVTPIILKEDVRVRDIAKFQEQKKRNESFFDTEAANIYYGASPSEKIGLRAWVYGMQGKGEELSGGSIGGEKTGEGVTIEAIKEQLARERSSKSLGQILMTSKSGKEAFIKYFSQPTQIYKAKYITGFPLSPMGLGILSGGGGVVLRGAMTAYEGVGAVTKPYSLKAAEIAATVVGGKMAWDTVIESREAFKRGEKSKAYGSLITLGTTTAAFTAGYMAAKPKYFTTTKIDFSDSKAKEFSIFGTEGAGKKSGTIVEIPEIKYVTKAYQKSAFGDIRYIGRSKQYISGKIAIKQKPFMTDETKVDYRYVTQQTTRSTDFRAKGQKQTPKTTVQKSVEIGDLTVKKLDDKKDLFFLTQKGFRGEKGKGAAPVKSESYMWVKKSATKDTFVVNRGLGFKVPAKETTIDFGTFGYGASGKRLDVTNEIVLKHLNRFFVPKGRYIHRKMSGLPEPLQYDFDITTPKDTGQIQVPDFIKDRPTKSDGQMITGMVADKPIEKRIFTLEDVVGKKEIQSQKLSDSPPSTQIDMDALSMIQKRSNIIIDEEPDYFYNRAVEGKLINDLKSGGFGDKEPIIEFWKNIGEVKGGRVSRFTPSLKIPPSKLKIDSLYTDKKSDSFFISSNNKFNILSVEGTVSRQRQSQKQQQATLERLDLRFGSGQKITTSITPHVTPPIPLLRPYPRLPTFPTLPKTNLIDWGGARSSSISFKSKQIKVKKLKTLYEPDLLSKGRSMSLYGKATPVKAGTKYEKYLKRAGSLGIRVPTVEMLKARFER